MGLICGRQTSCTLDCQPATYCCPVLHVGWMKYFITPNEDVPDARTGTSDRSSLHRPETARACVRYQDTFVCLGRQIQWQSKVQPVQKRTMLAILRRLLQWSERAFDRVCHQAGTTLRRRMLQRSQASSLRREYRVCTTIDIIK